MDPSISIMTSIFYGIVDKKEVPCLLTKQVILEFEDRKKKYMRSIVKTEMQFNISI